MNTVTVMSSVIFRYIQEDTTAFLINVIATVAAIIAATVALATGVEPGPETWGLAALLGVIVAEIGVHAVYFASQWIKEVNRLAKKSRASL